MKVIAFVYGKSVNPHKTFQKMRMTGQGQGHEKLQKIAILIEKNSNSESMKA